MSDLKVAVCVPSTGSWKSLTGKCIADMVSSFEQAGYEGGNKEISILSMNGQLLECRQQLVFNAWKWATHILFVDSDMVFPPDTIQRLLNHGKPIVGVNYSRRTMPARPVAYVDNDDQVGWLYTKEDSTGLVEVKHTGMGLMLIEVAVLDAIELPFFMFEPIAPHGVEFLSEDYYFCRKLKAAGIPVYVDQDLSKAVEHIGECHYTHTMVNVTENARLQIIHGKREQALAEEKAAREAAE